MLRLGAVKLLRCCAGAVVLALAAAVLTGCGSGDSPQPAVLPTTPTAPSATPAAGQAWQRAEELRGRRYCEVLLLEVIDGDLNARVWNSFGLNECPQDEWEALDATAIAADRGVVAALLNGPRYWLMDAIEIKPAGERQTATFGTLDMFLAATVDLGPVPPDLAPYTQRRVARETVFEFAAGAEVYELLAPDGSVYVMQSYSAQNAGLTEADLPALASRLMPPAGWSYRVRTLDATLRVLTPEGTAVVIQDDFANTYQLVEAD